MFQNCVQLNDNSAASHNNYGLILVQTATDGQDLHGLVQAKITSAKPPELADEAVAFDVSSDGLEDIDFGALGKDASKQRGNSPTGGWGVVQAAVAQTADKTPDDDAAILDEARTATRLGFDGREQVARAVTHFTFALAAQASYAIGAVKELDDVQVCSLGIQLAKGVISRNKATSLLT